MVNVIRGPGPGRVRVETQFLKLKGNEAFKASDYATACSLYTFALELDSTNCDSVLNRAWANLKLARWADAEQDATLAFEKLADSALDKQKALHRRCQARISQGKWDDARDDISALRSHGVDSKDVDKLESDLEASCRGDIPTVDSIQKPEAPPEPSIIPMESPFEIRDSPLAGLGAFATRDLRRGEMVLAEAPLLSDADMGESFLDMLRALIKLSPAQLIGFVSLTNAHSATYPNHFHGIILTNGFLEAGLFLQASRFNHSCSPNARYSFHETSGCTKLRIFATADILAGEEILVSYLADERCYGSTRDQRREILLKKHLFMCNCRSCSLEGPEQVLSDKRRLNILEIKNGQRTANIQNADIVSTDRCKEFIREGVKAMRLLNEEGLHSGADVFLWSLATVCSIRSDWDSTAYWLNLLFEGRRDEMGEDSEAAMRAKKMYQSPRSRSSFPQAGLLQLPRISIRLPMESKL